MACKAGEAQKILGGVSDVLRDGYELTQPRRGRTDIWQRGWHVPRPCGRREWGKVQKKRVQRAGERMCVDQDSGSREKTLKRLGVGGGESRQ